MSATPEVCSRCASPLEAGDLRCAVCSLACPRVRPADRPDAAIEILRCASCGAAMIYDPTVREPSCGFCGSTVELEHTDDPMEQASDLLPFRVDRHTATATLKQWLGNLGWFRPSDLLSSARLESIRPLWWVAWVFDAEAYVSWTADTEVGARKADWAPHAGSTNLDFDDIFVSASRGLTDAETARLSTSYDLAQSGEGGVEVGEPTIERFDVSRSVARRRVLEAIDTLAAQRLREGHVPGKRIRNLHTTILLRRLTTRRCALPAWVLAYRYKKRLYRFVVSGQDTTCLIGGAPYSTAKIIAAIAAAGGMAILVLLLILALAG